MKHELEHYEQLAGLFSYPDKDFVDRVRQAQTLLDTRYPAAGEAMTPFTDFVAGASLTTLEELYTRSFDVQAITTLDLGYVLFGDDYKRGALLVNLNKEHRDVGNDCHNELADHLPNVLRLLPKMEDRELRAELVERIVGPALQKIIGEFDPGKIDSKKKVYLKHHKTWIDWSEDFGTVFQRPLVALYTVLQEDFDMTVKTTRPTPSVDFLKNIDSEIELETD
jgi:nitrate reductase molybdenum cofactor assembly chaperone